MVVKLDGGSSLQGGAANHQADGPLDILAVEVDGVPPLHGTLDDKGGQLVVPGGGGLAAHLPDGVQQGGDGAVADLVISGDDALPLQHGGHGGEKVEAGAGVAHIQHGGGDVEALKARAGDDPIVVVGGVHLGPQAAAALGDVVVIQVQHGVEDMAGPLGQSAQHQAPGGLAFGAGDGNVSGQPAGRFNAVILHGNFLLNPLLNFGNS